jgi:hypothetical protein
MANGARLFKIEEQCVQFLLHILVNTPTAI